MFLNRTSDIFLRQLDKLKTGSISIEMPNGKSYQFGNSNSVNDNNVSPVKLTVKNWKVFQNLMERGDTGFAEDYRAGHWETDDLSTLLTLGILNEDSIKQAFTGGKLFQIISRLSYFMKRNTIDGSKRNIHAHYDLGNDFYSLWLDPTMTYSSAIFKNNTDDLETGQLQKYDRLIDRLHGDNQSILEVGCGWGGFADRVTEKLNNTKIDGVTISDEQFDYATTRLKDRGNIIKSDYRLLDGKYDHIVSIEMFEAVGEEYWATYFKKIATLLKEKGTALIQTITIADDKFDSYRKGNDVIRSLVFPGGMLPSPKIFKQVAAEQGLRVNDQFDFGQDYARTLEIWLENFDAKYQDVKTLGYDDGFIRLWRFYLASCIAGFRTERINVMQVEMAHAK
jgi:cyclopropane-fatty-acyl-phospholipid synthase